MFTAFPNQIGNDLRFGPPRLGGVVNVMFLSFAYNDTGIAAGETLFTLPYTAEIVGYTQNITTAFDGTGSNTLDYGTIGALAQFGSGLSAAATGQIDAGFVAAQMFTPLTGDIPFTVRYNGTSATVGAATICVFYIMRSQA